MLVDLARQWDAVLKTGLADVRRRSASGTWSALEYAAHVRDVLVLFRNRVERAVVEERPDFEWWDHEAAAVERSYNDQDPRRVARDLRSSAEGLAATLSRLGEDEWSRVGTRRAREPFTVEGLARFALHETEHHRVDALRSLE